MMPVMTRSEARAAAVVACFSALLYLPTLGYQLVWDDPVLLGFVQARLQSGGVPTLLSSEFLLGIGSSHTGYFRPMILLSLAIDGWLGGGSPWMYHLTNVVLHASICGLVVLVLSSIVRDLRSAIFGGALFAAHPVHVEAVAFVSGRTDLWAALFVFAYFALFARANDPEAKSSGWRAPTVAAAALSLGALSKEPAVMAVPAWTIWGMLGVFGAPPRALAWIRRNTIWLTASCAALVIVVALRWTALGSVMGAPEASTFNLLLSKLATYFKLLVLPWPLNAYYTRSDLTLAPAIVVGALVAVAVFALAEFKGARHSGAAGASWALCFLLPVLGVASVRGVAAAERFLYLPSFGVCLAATTLWGRLNRRNRVAAIAMGGALIAVCSGATLARSAVWRDNLVLYSNMVQTSPQSFVAHFNLGNEFAKLSRMQDAEASLMKAVEVGPAHADGWNNLGGVRTSLGKDIDAEKALAEAVRLAPELTVSRRNWAMALLKLRRPQEAYAALAAIEPKTREDAPPLIEAGQALAAAGQRSLAEEALLSAILAAPDSSQAYGILGFVYLREGKAADALSMLEKAKALDSTDPFTRFNLGIVRQSMGDAAGAASERDALRSMDPRLADELTDRLARLSQPRR